MCYRWRFADVPVGGAGRCHCHELTFTPWENQMPPNWTRKTKQHQLSFTYQFSSVSYRRTMIVYCPLQDGWNFPAVVRCFRRLTLSMHQKKRAQGAEKTGERWRVSPPYLMGSWSSLFSLLWMIFIPLFLARGHPERLQTNDSVAKLSAMDERVRSCAMAGEEGGGRRESK